MSARRRRDGEVQRPQTCAWLRPKFAQIPTGFGQVWAAPRSFMNRPELRRCSAWAAQAPRVQGVAQAVHQRRGRLAGGEPKASTTAQPNDKMRAPCNKYRYNLTDRPTELDRHTSRPQYREAEGPSDTTTQVDTENRASQTQTQRQMQTQTQTRTHETETETVRVSGGGACRRSKSPGATACRPRSLSGHRLVNEASARCWARAAIGAPRRLGAAAF